MSLDLSRTTSLLFVPGHRPDRYGKALAASPDGIVIDLEDAVPAAEKNAARQAAAAFLKETGRTAPILLRLNPIGTRPGLDDLAALADGLFAADGILLAKVEAPRDIEIVRAHDDANPILAAIETATGLEAAPEIARALRTGDALGFGGADLAADLGCAFGWEPLFSARCALVRAAAIGRVGLFDVPHLDIADKPALESETGRVKALGFTGKLAIHPGQIETIRRVFQPSPADIDRARRIIAALEAASGGAAQLDGKMIDLPVAIAARRTLALAGQHS
jgi:citrate lyase beta subunit